MRWLWCGLCCALPAIAEAAEPVHLAGLFVPDEIRQEAPANAKPDRWGRYIVMDEALGVSLLTDGRAQIQPEDGTPIPSSWWTAEAVAQAAERGLWGQDCCRVLQAVGPAPSLPLLSWRVVQGQVTAVQATKSGTYVNFGPNPATDWKTDFSVKLAPRLAAKMQASAWVGQTLQVRGFVSWMYGPSLEILVPAQVQVMSAK